MQNYGMNLFFGSLWLIMLVLIANPGMVGEWQAQRDVMYNTKWAQIMGEEMP
jgi:hypothetical protein